jgi:signal transduction histidine kinase
MKYLITSLLLLASIVESIGQDTTFVLSTDMYDESGWLSLPTMNNWLYRNGNNPEWAKTEFNISNWQRLDSTQFEELKEDKNGIFEAWFRIKIKLDTTFFEQPIYIFQRNAAASDIYVNGELVHSFGNTGSNGEAFKNNIAIDLLPGAIFLNENIELTVAIHIVDKLNFLKSSSSYSSIGRSPILYFVKYDQVLMLSKRTTSVKFLFVAILSLTGLIVILSWLMTFFIKGQKHIMIIAILTSGIFLLALSNFLIPRISPSSILRIIAGLMLYISLYTIFISLPILIFKILSKRITPWLKYYAIFSLLYIPFTYYFDFPFAPFIGLFSFLICTYILVAEWKKIHGSQWAIVIGLVLLFLSILMFGFFSILRVSSILSNYDEVLLLGIYLFFPASLMFYIVLWLQETIRDERINAQKVVQVTEEKRDLLANQNKILEQKVNERTTELHNSLENLKATQSQLIQSEKMASLGELTAGIAHEIQNPLNFVNNFSEVSKELIIEMKEELEKGDVEEVKEIANDIDNNLDKIHHHGQRAEGIVKGMLQHSRTSQGEKEPADINALADEYLRLAYHGMRAKDKSFNAEFKTDFDPNLPKVNVVPQDIGRVLLNLINNAFYAVNQKSHRHSEQSEESDNYKPMVTVSTKILPLTPSGGGHQRIQISVKDNGPGIPEHIREKIFQPFFTTKPTGSGTGLGLSLSYDIVKAHGGEIKAESKENEGSVFIIKLPIA